MVSVDNPLYEESPSDSNDSQKPYDSDEPELPHNSNTNGARNTTTDARPAKKQRLSHTDTDNIQNAQQAEASLINIQINDLIQENNACTPDALTKVNSFVHLLSNTLRSLPCSTIPPSSSSTTKSKPSTTKTTHTSLSSIQPYLDSLSFKLEKDFTFHPPENVHVIGTWAYNAALNNNNNNINSKADVIDIAVQIPRQCFDDKDQLNHRYHGKRLIYLSHIAQCLLASSSLLHQQEEEEDKLKKKKKKTVKKDDDGNNNNNSNNNNTSLQVQSVEWEMLSSSDDARRPVLALHSPKLTTSTSTIGEVIDLEGYVIRLVPCIAPDTFPLSKLAPGRNNLRTMTSSSLLSGVGLSTTTTTTTTTTDTANAANANANANANAIDHQMSLLPTPRYNSTIIQDMLLQYHTAVYRELSSKTCPGFSNAVIMLDIWSRYHLHSSTTSSGGGECSDAIGGEFLTMLLVHLLHNGQANSGMAPLQLVRCVLVALSNSKKVLGSMQGGLFMKYVPLSSSSSAYIHSNNGSGSGGGSSAQPPSAKEWKFLQQQQQSQSHSPILFIDCSGWYNIASAISRGALVQAQDCAGRTIKLLNNATPEAFDAVFGRASPIPQLFDYWYKVTIPTSSSSSSVVATSGMFSRDVTDWQEQDCSVAYHAQRAAGNRATLVRVLHRPATLHHHQHGKHSSSSSSLLLLPVLHPPTPTRRHVLLAVRVDPTAVLRTVDRGPPADAKTAAAAFRILWGDKAELRRFQDGSICEAVVWEEGNNNNNNNGDGSSSSGGGRLSRRHTILDQAMSHVLQRHLPKGTQVWGCSDVLDAALQRGIKSKTGDYSNNNSMEEDVLAERSCETAVEKLSKQLRSLQSPDDITLRVVSTQPLSSVLRHTAPFPPLPHPLAGGGGGDSFGTTTTTTTAASTVARCLDPVEVACQLEGSGRWPDSPLAYFKMKAALGVQLAEALRLSYGMEAVASETYIDVLTDGFAFRLLLVAERDKMMSAAAASILITSSKSTPTSTTTNDTTNTVEAATMARLIPIRSWHQGAMSSIHAANPAFGPTVRLAKRWMGAHLLSNHYREEAIELLVAYCFTDTARNNNSNGRSGGTAFATSNYSSTPTVPPSPPPSSRLSGFLRFLRLLSDHPWHVDCIIVDPNKELSPTECAAALRRYKQDSIIDGGGGRSSRAALGIITPKTPTIGGEGGGGEGEDGSKAASTSATLSIWSVGRPSTALVHRTAVLARRSADALEHMILEDTNGGGGSNTKSTNTNSAAIIKSVVFSSDLSDYDVIIKIRKDAVTHPDRSLLPSGIVTSSGNSNGALVASSSLKQSRAVVSGIPISVVNKRGASAVRNELLIGFQPLNIYIDQLEDRFGSVAVFCGADCSNGGGGDVVGVKWKKSSGIGEEVHRHHLAFQPEMAHLVKPVNIINDDNEDGGGGGGIGGEKKKKKRSGGGVTMVVADVDGIIGEMGELGAGMVEGVFAA